MKRVFEYPLTLEAEQNITMPLSAELLGLQVRGEIAVLWAIVDHQNRDTQRRVYLVATATPGRGDPPLDKARYIGTFQLAGGDIVYHVFDAGEFVPGT